MLSCNSLKQIGIVLEFLGCTKNFKSSPDFVYFLHTARVETKNLTDYNSCLANSEQTHTCIHTVTMSVQTRAEASLLRLVRARVVTQFFGLTFLAPREWFWANIASFWQIDARFASLKSWFAAREKKWDSEANLRYFVVVSERWWVNVIRVRWVYPRGSDEDLSHRAGLRFASGLFLLIY